MQCIYRIRNTVNNKLYVGKAIKVKMRWKYGHINPLKKNSHDNKHLQSSWNKYKEENFVFEIIEEIDDELMLNEREIYWIAYYKSSDPNYGYNKTDGGDGGKMPEESLKKMVKTCRERGVYENRKHSPETKQKIGKANKGKTRKKGFKHTETSKLKMSNSQKGKKKSPEHVKKIADAQRGENSKYYQIPRTHEVRQKISNSKLGCTVSDETKEKIRKTLNKFSDEQIIEILIKLKNNETISKIARDYSVNHSTIARIRDNVSYTHINRGAIK